MHIQQKAEEETAAPGPNEQGQEVPGPGNPSEQHPSEITTTALVAATPEPEFVEGEVVEDLSEDRPEPIAEHPSSPRIRSFLPMMLTILACLVFVLVSSLLPTLNPTATITIIPIEHTLTTTATLLVGQGTHDIPGRLLSPLTITQSITALATGRRHQQAQAAQGPITFYNALPSPQTIPAGELLRGSDQIQVLTLRDAVIPAGRLATNGQVTVPARAVNAGPQGNIRAGDIYGKCCRENVFVSNGPFSGGQNARSYRIATQQDINGVASSLKASLDQSVQAALSQQVQPTETLVTPIPCNSSVIPDHKAGSETTQISVTVSETCTGEVYKTSALDDLLMQTLTQQAIKQLGKGYGLVGDFQMSITRATMNTRQEQVILQVKVVSTWMYQFSHAEQDQIKLTIRGKSKENATALLLHMPGIQSVSISISNGNALPTEVQHIHLNFVLLA
jgi:hypothetical protein